VILWTAMPVEYVLADLGLVRPRLCERPLPGGGMMLIDSSSGEERIFRLLSSDPQVYLRPEFSPGQNPPAPHGGSSER
jgi:hypothetical protein